jgi:hypothetical protein
MILLGLLYQNNHKSSLKEHLCEMKAAKQAAGGQPATGISSTWAAASDSPKSIIDTEATGKHQRPHGIIPLSLVCTSSRKIF